MAKNFLVCAFGLKMSRRVDRRHTSITLLLWSSKIFLHLPGIICLTFPNTQLPYCSVNMSAMIFLSYDLPSHPACLTQSVSDAYLRFISFGSSLLCTFQSMAIFGVKGVTKFIFISVMTVNVSMSATSYTTRCAICEDRACKSFCSSYKDHYPLYHLASLLALEVFVNFLSQSLTFQVLHCLCLYLYLIQP